MAYQAIVSRIAARPFPGSDNIVLGNCLNYNVIIDKSVQDGSIGIFFEQGGQLSPEFAAAHDLVSRKDAEGNRAGGYFEENRRVKSVKMRGAISEGFFCPLSFLEFTGVDISKFKEGDQFDAVNGIPICNKYYTPRTARAIRDRQSNRAPKRENIMFKKHIDTSPLKRSIHMIPKDAYIIITAKIHGTSHRTALVIEETPILRKGVRAWWAKVTKQPQSIRGWKLVHGSRNVVLNDAKIGFCGSNEFRYRALYGVALHKGEVLYGEIVGYTHDNSPIMDRHNIEKLKDKNIEKIYGKEITYSYGCAEGECKFFIYRITQVNEDGQVTELSWNQVTQRAAQLAIPTVPLLETFIYDGNQEELAKRVGRLVDGETGQDAIPSVLDPSHIEEGIVVRYESPYGVDWLKSKNFQFSRLEDITKDNADFVDMEEVA